MAEKKEVKPSAKPSVKADKTEVKAASPKTAAKPAAKSPAKKAGGTAKSVKTPVKPSAKASVKQEKKAPVKKNARPKTGPEAVVISGGKQYKVRVGEIFKVELLEAKAGSKVDLDVIMVVDGENVKVGTPLLAGTKCSAEILEHGKAKKIVVYKYEAKKNSRRKNGHRQPYTVLKVLAIG